MQLCTISYLWRYKVTSDIQSEMKRFDHITKEIDAAYHEAALKLGLSDSAMLILYTIANHGQDCLLSDITRLSGARKQTVNSAIRKLENDEIVYLEPAGGKKKRVHLTEKGEEVVKDTVCKIIDIENKIFVSWQKRERDLYLELTQRYLTAFKEEIKKL